jgi:hypothetical protein
MHKNDSSQENPPRVPKRKFWLRIFKICKRWSSTLAIIMALVSLCFSWLQLQNSTRQAAAAEGGRDAAQRSAQAAGRSASAAEEAVRNTLQGNRARLGSILANATSVAAGQKPAMDLLLQNKGRSTATEIVQKVWIQLLDSRIKQLPHPPTEPLEAESLAADGMIVTNVGFHRPLTQQDVDEITAGKKALFIYGEVEYSDETRQYRKVRWCSYYMTDKPTSYGLLPNCRFHNSSN